MLKQVDIELLMVEIKNTWQKTLKQVDIDLLMVEIKNTWQKRKNKWK